MQTPWGDTLRDHLLAASLIPGISPAVAIPALLADPDHYLDPPSLPPRARALWRTATTDPTFAHHIATERAALDRLGAWYLTPADPDWPATLPPIGVLRGRGHLRVPGLAIVGARRADAHGRDIAARIACAAVARDLAVISGGAFGIDHAAHRAALDADGTTIVVLGSGLALPSPTAHLKLFEAAERRGAVVSPFPCTQAATKWTFPRRNAWIAGLSLAVTVVQASTTSGALHTARAALATAIPVFVVPGPMDSPLHTGCHALVAEGARLLTDPTAWSTTPRATPPPATQEPPAHHALWRAAGGEPRALDALATEAGLPIPDAATAATLLELDGWLRPAPGGRYVQSRPH